MQNNLLVKRSGVFLGYFFVCIWVYAASLPYQSEIIKTITSTQNRRNISIIDWPHSDHSLLIDENITKAEKTLALGFNDAQNLKQAAWYHALKMRPLSASNWIHLSAFYRHNSRKDDSSRALKVAEKLGWNRHYFLDRLLAQYLLQGDLDDVTRIARRLLYIHALKTNTLYQMFTRFMSKQKFVQDVVPLDPLDNGLSRMYYLNHLLAYEYKSQKNTYPKFAEMIWNISDLAVKRQLLGDATMIKRLMISPGGYAVINRISLDINNNIYRGKDFILDFKNKAIGIESICWKLSDTQGVLTNQLDQSGSDQKLFEVSFDQSWNQPFSLNCYLPLQVAKQQVLLVNGSWQGIGFDQDSNSITSLAVNILGKDGVEGRNKYQIKESGRWAEKQFNFKFTITPNAKAVQFLFSRKKLDKLPQIGGTLRLGEIKLTNQSLVDKET